MLASLADEYSGPDVSLDEPLLSPLLGDLVGLPPTLLQVGDCEIGLSDSIAYAEKMESAGGDATLSIWPDMIHVFQMYADDLESGVEAIQQIGTFIQDVVRRAMKKTYRLRIARQSHTATPAVPTD